MNVAPGSGRSRSFKRERRQQQPQSLVKVKTGDEFERRIRQGVRNRILFIIYGRRSFDCDQAESVVGEPGAAQQRVRVVQLAG